MVGIKSFEDMKVWQDARQLTQLIRKICMREPASKDFVWRDQAMRAGISIMANIAEGFEAQSDASFATFCGYSKRSSAEVRSHFYFGLDSGYMNRDEFDEGLILARRISAGLTHLIQYLRISKRKRRSTGKGTYSDSKTL